MSANDSDHVWWIDDDPSEWIPSETPGVYFRTEADASGMSGYDPDAARKNGERIQAVFGDDVTVVITAGPYRSHDVAYEADADARRVRLDYYSVRAGTHHIEEIIEDLRDGAFAEL